MLSVSNDYNEPKGLSVINREMESVKPRGDRSLSEINRECLINRANEIAKKLMNGGNESKGPGFLAGFGGNNFDKGVTQVGTYTGNALCSTYGAEASNKAVGFVVRKLMGTMSGKMLDLAIGAAQIAVTPKVLPFLTAFSGAAGGIALPAAVGLVGALYNRLLASGKYTLETLPSPDQLIRYDHKERCFYDALGEELGEQELKDLQVLVLEYDLICKILASDKDNVANVVLDSLDFQSDEYQNLEPIEKMLLQKEIETTTKRLQENNRYERGEGILPGINHLARNFIPLVNREKVEEEQRRHVEEQKMQSIISALKNVTAKIGIPSDADLYYFDDSSKSFYVPSNALTRWWYSQSAAMTAEKVSGVMQEALLNQCDLIDGMVDQVNEVSDEGMIALFNEMAEVSEGFHSLHKIAENSKGNEPLTNAVDQLFLETKKRFNSIKSKLALKLS